MLKSMTNSTPIATTILANVDNDRLSRGVEGLTSGAYHITRTRHTEHEISAHVANGDGKTYAVTLTEGRAFCGCGDAMYRGMTCKHSVALALHTIRTPQAEPKQEEPKPLNLKLAKVRRWA
jgi:uncharacterized Zn finger protein